MRACVPAIERFLLSLCRRGAREYSDGESADSADTGSCGVRAGESGVRACVQVSRVCVRVRAGESAVRECV